MHKNTHEEDLYTVSEVADITKTSVSTVKRWLSNGLVRYVQIGDGWRRVPESEIERITTVKNVVI